MFWSTINIEKLSRDFLSSSLRDDKFVALSNVFLMPLQNIADETLYKMQHNGTKIYLEKMLNESYSVPGYDHQNHEDTKLIYIDDLPAENKLYIWQDEEPENTFLEDDGDENEDDIFLNGDTEGNVIFSWTIYMPDTIAFNEITLRALVDSYRYIGKKYTIEIYTP